MIIINSIFNSIQRLWYKKQPKPLIFIPNDLLPYGIPLYEKPLFIIYRSGYVCGYDPHALIPKWVCWTNLYKNINNLSVPRQDCFEKDHSLINFATPTDYHKTGYDLGHLCPCEDMSYSVLTQKESFIMSNITPQYPNFNRIVWRNLEEHCRDLVRISKADFWNIVVSVYDQNCQKINGITIPLKFERMIVNINTKEKICYSYPHLSDLTNSDPTVYRVDNLSDVIVNVAPKTGIEPVTT